MKILDKDKDKDKESGQYNPPIGLLVLGAITFILLLYLPDLMEAIDYTLDYEETKFENQNQSDDYKRYIIDFNKWLNNSK